MPLSSAHRRWFRLPLRIVIIFLLLFICSCFLVDQYVQFRWSDKQFEQFFRSNHIDGSIQYYEAGGRKIRYVKVGPDSLPVLLFIHGAPSSSSLFAPYFKDSLFRKTFCMYAVDRPGYGGSGFGIPEPSIKQQAYDIHFILDSLQHIHRPVVVIGQSYGSSIACRLAMDYPSLVDALVLSGPSLAPGREKTYWFTKPVESPLVNWFVPRMFVSANNEKIHHREELTRMLPLWSGLRMPVTYLQGSKDELIYPSNAAFAKEHITNSSNLHIRFFPNRPHFIAHLEFPAIRQEILDSYHRVEKNDRQQNTPQ